MGMSREEAILKIKKCLALAKSANENEAAIALRQAQSLMREFQIDPDLLGRAGSRRLRETPWRSQSTSPEPLGITFWRWQSRASCQAGADGSQSKLRSRRPKSRSIYYRSPGGLAPLGECVQRNSSLIF